MPFKTVRSLLYIKKQNKPLDDSNTYRRITIIIGKVFEKLHLKAIQRRMDEQQNPWQRDFTKGTSPELVFTSLLLTEAISESNDLKTVSHATFLYATKIFYTVWPAPMLRKLHRTSLCLCQVNTHPHFSVVILSSCISTLDTKVTITRHYILVLLHVWKINLGAQF